MTVGRYGKGAFLHRPPETTTSRTNTLRRAERRLTYYTLLWHYVCHLPLVEVSTNVLVVYYKPRKIHCIFEKQWW